MAIGLIACLLLTYFTFFEHDEEILLIIWGVITMVFSILIAYVFASQTTDLRPLRNEPNRYSAGYDSFKPRVIPPSGMKKRTQFEGRCNQCGMSALLGFTCSYCGGYFCTDHRLPEKHNCEGLYK